MKKGRKSVAITLGIVCFLLVMTIFMQFKVVQETEEANIDLMQEAELRQQLASWKTKYEETREKYNEMSETLRSYKEESTSDSEKKEALEKELENLELFLGKTDVEGEGVEITLTRKSEQELSEDEQVIPIVAEDLVYIVNYLKDAGAEAISINEERIVNITDIVDVGDSIKVNSKYLRTDSYTIKAIGNSSYLESSVFGKGGYVEQLNTTGINAKIERANKIKIAKYNRHKEIKYKEEIQTN